MCMCVHNDKHLEKIHQNANSIYSWVMTFYVILNFLLALCCVFQILFIRLCIGILGYRFYHWEKITRHLPRLCSAVQPALAPWGYLPKSEGPHPSWSFLLQSFLTLILIFLPKVHLLVLLHYLQILDGSCVPITPDLLFSALCITQNLC